MFDGRKLCRMVLTVAEAETPEAKDQVQQTCDAMIEDIAQFYSVLGIPLSETGASVKVLGNQIEVIGEKRMFAFVFETQGEKT